MFNGQIEGTSGFTVSMDENGKVMSSDGLTEEQVAELEANSQITLASGEVMFKVEAQTPLTEEELKEMGFEVVEVNSENIEILEVENGLRVKVYNDDDEATQGFITSTEDGELKGYQMVSESSVAK